MTLLAASAEVVGALPLPVPVEVKGASIGTYLQGGSLLALVTLVVGCAGAAFKFWPANKQVDNARDASLRADLLQMIADERARSDEEMKSERARCDKLESDMRANAERQSAKIDKQSGEIDGLRTKVHDLRNEVGALRLAAEVAARVAERESLK